jgi:hypothetical protein
MRLPVSSNQQDVRLSDKRILPSLPKSVRDMEKFSEVEFLKIVNHGK